MLWLMHSAETKRLRCCSSILTGSKSLTIRLVTRSEISC